MVQINAKNSANHREIDGNLVVEMSQKKDIYFDGANRLEYSKSQGVTPEFRCQHYHDAYEINFITQGRGYYLVNGQRTNFQEGDFILINSEEIHCAFEATPLVMEILMVSEALRNNLDLFSHELWEPFTEIEVYYPRKLSPGHPAYSKALQLFRQIEKEHKANQELSEINKIAYYLELLVHLARHTLLREKQDIDETRLSKAEPLRKVLDEIDQNYQRNWTLQELADIAYMSPSHFSEIFAQFVDTTPMDYVIRKRVSEACKLLIDSDQSIARIAEQVGFSSLSNFNRQFKRRLEMTPSQYRKARKSE